MTLSILPLSMELTRAIPMDPPTFDTRVDVTHRADCEHKNESSCSKLCSSVSRGATYPTPLCRARCEMLYSVKRVDDTAVGLLFFGTARYVGSQRMQQASLSVGAECSSHI